MGSRSHILEKISKFKNFVYVQSIITLVFALFDMIFIGIQFFTDIDPVYWDLGPEPQKEL